LHPAARSLDRGRRRPRGYAAARAGRTGVGRSGVAAVALLFVPGVQELSQSYLAYWSAPRKCSDTCDTYSWVEGTEPYVSLHFLSQSYLAYWSAPRKCSDTYGSVPSTQLS